MKPMKWEKIHANHISVKELISKIKNSYNSTEKKKILFKMGKGTE